MVLVVVLDGRAALTQASLVRVHSTSLLDQVAQVVPHFALFDELRLLARLAGVRVDGVLEVGQLRFLRGFGFALRRINRAVAVLFDNFLEVLFDIAGSGHEVSLLQLLLGLGRQHVHNTVEQFLQAELQVDHSIVRLHRLGVRGRDLVGLGFGQPGTVALLWLRTVALLRLGCGSWNDRSTTLALFELFSDR